MKTVRYTGILLIVLYMVFAVRITAFAEENIVQSDESHRGSITVDMVSTESGKTIAGGTLTLYQAAEAEMTEGKIKFIYTDAFAQCGLSLENIEKFETEKKELAEDLETYVKQNDIAGQSAVVDKSGHVAWTDLEQGLYLIVQTGQAEDYAPIQTFLVSIPEVVDGACIYEINAKPKTGTINTSDDSIPEKDKAFSDNKLPQTG